MNYKSPFIRPEQIEQAILLIRGQRVTLDRDLAALYGVETKTLNKAVRRNLDRFPADFMFQLTAEESESLRFQLGTFKAWPAFQVSVARFHTGRCRDAFERAARSARRPGQHRHHARFCALARDAGLAQGTRPQAGGIGAQDR